MKEQSSERVFLICVGTLGIILNWVVCQVILFSKHLRQPLDRLILNLSIADLMNSVTIVLFQVIEYIIIERSANPKNISYLFHEVVCKMWLFFVCMSMTSSSQTLATIGIERWKAILHPFGKPFSGPKFGLIILFNWLISAGVAIFIALLHRPLNSYPLLCVGSKNIILSMLSCLIFTLTTSFIPFVIVLVCYIRIGIKLYTAKLPIDSIIYAQKVSQTTKRKYRKIITLLMITVLTMATSIQFSISYLFTAIGPMFHQNFYIRLNIVFWKFYRTTWILTIISSTLNPILYNFCSENFQKAITSKCKYR